MFFKEARDENNHERQREEIVQRGVKCREPTIVQHAAALRNNHRGYRLYHDPSMFPADRATMFRHFKPLVFDNLANLPVPYQAYWNMTFRFLMKRYSNDDSKVAFFRCLQSGDKFTRNKQEAQTLYEDIQHDLERQIEEMQASNGSGWYPERVIEAHFNLVRINPLSGHAYFPIPTYENAKCGLVNIKNTDKCCFLWSMCAAIQFQEKEGTAGNRPWTDPKRLRTTFNRYWKQLSQEQQQVFTEEGMNTNKILLPDMEKIFKRNINIYQMIIEDGRPGDLFTDESFSAGSFKHEVKLLKAINLDTGENHYVWIKNFEHFRSRTRRPNYRYPQEQCEKCLLLMPEEQMQDHVCGEKFRTQIVPARIEKGKDKPYMRFREGRRKQEMTSLVIYADFEAVNAPIEGETSSKSTVKLTRQDAVSYAFLPVATIANPETGERFQPQRLHIYKGEDAAKQFLRAICNYTDRNFDNLIDTHLPMNDLTPEEQAEFDEAEYCHICQQPGNWVPERDGVEMANTKVRDHDHYTGRFRGAAHAECNNNHGKYPTVTVIFHNLKGYDSHFLIPELDDWHGRNKIMSENMEQMKSLTLGRFIRPNAEDDPDKKKRYYIRFIDSFAYLPMSLDKLVNLNLEDGNKGKASGVVDISREENNVVGRGRATLFPFTKRFLEQQVPRQLSPQDRSIIKNYLLRKGYFPYEWFDNISKLDVPLFDNDGVFVLEPCDFYSRLGGTYGQDTVHKQQWCRLICEMMNYKSFEQYHDLYLGLDVCLLADVFQKYRITCEQQPNIKLDPCHYFGTPSLVIDSFLKYTDTPLEIIPDKDVYLQYRRDGMRGGISFWGNYYAQANNPLHEEEYDMSLATTYIDDQDCCSLYPCAARQRLPVTSFTDILHEEMTGEKMWDFVMNMLFEWPDDQGCDLWVDVYLPVTVEEWMQQVPNKFHRYLEGMAKFDNNLHDYQANYPLLVEVKETPTERLSERQRQLYGTHKPCKKLITDLMPKSNYKIYYLTLRQALERGWVITKIHSRFEFKQDYTCRDFIDECVSRRAAATNEFERKLQKDAMNSFIGKTIQDDFKLMDTMIFSNLEKFSINYIRGRVKDSKALKNGNVLAQLYRKRVECRRPQQIGITVYEISKIFMSSLWYLLQDYYGPKIRLLGTDTDSLIFIVETESYEADKEMFNQRSLFEEDHPFYRNSRFSDKVTKELLEQGINPYIGIFDTGAEYMKSVPGFFKPDNTNIIECCALRAKMYSLRRNVRGDKVWVKVGECKWQLQDMMDVQMENMTTSEQLSKKKYRDICKAKGLSSQAVNQQLTHKKYKETVLNPFDNLNHKVTSCSIRSKNQIMCTEKQTKSSLKAVDDKRYSEDGITSLPFGHYRIPK